MQFRRLLAQAPVVALIATIAACMIQPATAQQSKSQLAPLSRAALEALVAPYALYPDAVVEVTLDAAQHPSLVHEAAQLTPSAQPNPQWPESIRQLTQEPRLLKQLDADIALTARLGIAAREQLEDTWRAVDSVRQKMEAVAAAEQPAEGVVEQGVQSSTGGTAVAAPIVPYSGAVAAALWTDAVLHELSGYHQSYHQTYGTTTTNQAQAQAQGQVSGSVTQNGNTTSFQSSGSGSVQTNAGYGGTATRSGQGSVTQNSDGSTSFQRSAEGAVNGNQGSGNYSHSGSGTVTGDGNGSYQGSTNVQTQKGQVSTSTSAGNGQVTTTVDGPNGTNTYTAGDGQVGSGGQSTSNSAKLAESSNDAARTQGEPSRKGDSASRRNGSQRSSSLGRPQSVPGDSRFKQFGARNGALGGRNAAARAKPNNRSFGRPQSMQGAAGTARSGSSFGRPGSLSGNQSLGRKGNAGRSSAANRSRSMNRAPTSSRSSGRSAPSRGGGGRRGRR